MHANYAGALAALFPGRHRAKRIQSAFDVSERTAKNLLAGKHWTLARVLQAAELFGEAWDAALSRPDTNWRHAIEMQEIEQRLARLEKQFGEMARRDNAGLAPQSSASANSFSRGFKKSDIRPPGDG